MKKEQLSEVSEMLTLKRKGRSDWMGWTSGIYEDEEDEEDDADEDFSLLESKYAGMSVRDVLKFFDSYSNHTWIFFDTETLGFDPYNKQLTEIAAVAVTPDDWVGEPTIVGTFNEKIKLSDGTVEKIRQERDLSPEEQSSMGRTMTSQDILSMTRYGEKGREYKNEDEVLTGFVDFVSSFSNPVLVAQNASFDMKFISVRSGGQLKRYPVIDTMRVMQLFLIPLLRSLRDEQGDQEAADFLSKIKRRRKYSASMGVVSDAYGISTEEWHNALADVQMMMALFQHIIESLRAGEDVDIKTGHSWAVKNILKRKRF